MVIAVAVALWVVAWQLDSTRARQLVLLASSYLFYAWFGGRFVAILIASSILNWALGSHVRRFRRGYFWLAIALNTALLAFFKYVPALLTWNGSTSQTELAARIAMPIGISFWTFQALSYHIDTYLEDDIDPSLLEFCLYMAFWPTVLSGPVCRVSDLLPQLRRTPVFSWDDISDGLRYLIQGFVMKMFLAQLLSSGWNPGEGITAGFDGRTAWGGTDVWLLAIGFGFQLFFDFAGYSLMVLGIARLFGIRLPPNFNRPFLSRTPTVFWQRWHMSLSFWIRDYIFFPLSTVRRDTWWVYVALVISMTLFGVWHGAKWTFVIYGAYQGLLLVAHRVGQQLTRRRALALPPQAAVPLAWATTFLLVSLGFVMFRANDLTQIWTMLTAIVSPRAYAHSVLPSSLYLLTLAMVAGYFTVVGVGRLVESWATAYKERRDLDVTLDRAGAPAVAGALVAFLGARLWWWLAPAVVSVAVFAALAIYIQGAAIATTPFIYTLF
jgi:alginate O-acetyltransferase complex protein AlgI